MFISKKRWQALIKRIADLEGRVQSQQHIPVITGKTSKISTSSFR
jgi:hypothetical protein